MNKLLVIVIILVLIYFYYQQNQRPSIRPTHSQSTQTNLPDPALTQLQSDYNQLQNKHQKLIKFQSDFLKILGYSSYQELEKGVKELKSKIAELGKKPTVKSKSMQTPSDDKELENTIDSLLKNIQEMNNLLT